MIATDANEFVHAGGGIETDVSRREGRDDESNVRLVGHTPYNNT